MIRLPYWHVDAFADRPFAGNQAAVMPLDQWLDDATLLAIAEENNFAETAFLVKDETGEADWELRWFTPTMEIRLCGHATLASGHVLLARDGGERITFRTRKAGVLEVAPSDSGYELGLPLIESGLGSLGDDQFICTAPGERTDVVSRVFVPGGGVDEDSFTGSAHACLTHFWTERLRRDSFTAHQASRRGGDATCRREGDRAMVTVADQGQGIATDQQALVFEKFERLGRTDSGRC